jgi:uncharacterized protein YkwD
MTGASGYSGWGENLAQGHATANEVMFGPFGWMSSAGHRANILNGNFTHLGVGYDADGATWVQVFLRRP